MLVRGRFDVNRFEVVKVLVFMIFGQNLDVSFGRHGRLPAQQRLAMRLRFGEDRSLKEAAQIMGKSEPAVKLLIYRAVGRLRSETADRGRAPMPSTLAAS